MIRPGDSWEKVKGMKPCSMQYVGENLLHIDSHYRAGNDDHATMVEHNLWYDVLLSIAIGVDDPKAMAKKAIETTELDFKRTYTDKGPKR